jgi:hypothetical protein
VNPSASLTSDLPEVNIVLQNASAIEPWNVAGASNCSGNTTLHLVTEELVGSNASKGYDDECFTGKTIRTYSTSHFLDHIVRDTGAHIEPPQHYKLICLNHLIDVVAYAPPQVRLLSNSETPDQTRRLV